MFNKNDPMINTVKKIMEENVRRREIERKLCEELGIPSRDALPHEHVANFNALLEERISEALGGTTLTEEIVKEGAIKRALIDREEKERLAKRKAAGLKNDDDDTPPFDADKKKSTPWTSPSSKAKHLARNAMKDMIKKTKKVDEETENLQELSKKTIKSYIKKAKDSLALRSHESAYYAEKKRGATTQHAYDYSSKQKKKYEVGAEKRAKGINKALDRLEEDGTEVTLESVMKEITRNLGEAKVKSVKESDWTDNTFAATDKNKEKSSDSSPAPSSPAPAARADSSAEKETPSATGTALGAAARSGPIGAIGSAVGTAAGAIRAAGSSLASRASIGNSAARSTARGSAQAATSPPPPAIRAPAPASGGAGSGATASQGATDPGTDAGRDIPAQPTATPAAPARTTATSAPARPATRPAATRPVARPARAVPAARPATRPANTMSDRDRNALRIGGAVDAFSESSHKKR